MSNSIDERIVQMTFKSADFVNGVTHSIGVLQKLKDSLKFEGASKGLDEISQQARNFSLGGMSAAADHVANRFSAMRVVAFSVISNITNRALNAGISLVKAFTIDPIKAGLQSYETKINAIQTILANTASEHTNLNQVSKALNQLNQYANLTVYNFATMAKNIGTFTAAGVGLNTSVSAIKGIANLAALSGSSADQASSAMYQLSQAIAAGRVKLQDWNSVVNAGLGGKVFQTAILQTAKVNGVAVDAMLKKYGGFRNSLQSGFLTSKILTETLSEFTGDLSAQQLRAMGFTAAETDAIIAQAKVAVKSATQIRTVSQLMAALKDDVSTAWASVWEAIIGNFKQAPQFLTTVFNTLSSAAIGPIYKLAAFLTSFRKLGGFGEVIQIVINGFQDLKRILDPVKEAFQDVFPPATALGLIKIVVAIEQFTEKIRLSSAGMVELRTTFDGVFSVIKIVVDVITGLFGSLSKAGSAAGQAGGGILQLTSKVGQFLVNIRKAIESGGALAKFFGFLGTVLALPVKLLGDTAGALSFLADAAKKALAVIQPYVTKIVDEFKQLGGAIVDAVKSGNFSEILTALNQILFGGVLLAVRGFIKKLTGSIGGGEGGPGLFGTIKESFETLTGTLKTMQTSLKSDILLKIGAAVALLAASVVALSQIDTGKLAKALTAISVMFVQLLAGMAIISKISNSGGIIKMGVIAAALILLSTSILILSAAVAVLAHFSWEQLAKGLGTVAGLLTTIVVAARLMSGASKSLILTAVAMNLIAIALNVLAGAVALLGHLNIQTLGKGVGAIAALLLIIAAFSKLGGGPALIATAAGMVILGAALNVIALAVKTLGQLSIGTLAKGVGTIAVALLLIAGAMRLMPTDLIVTAAGLLVVSVALEILSKVLKTLGNLSVGEIVKSLVTLAAALLIIAGAMVLMEGALPGAAALIVVAAALAVLTPVLLALGGMSWTSIVKGLVALAGVFVVIGLAGLLLAPLVPVLLALGVAITFLGVGILAAGVGVAAFAIGITTLVAAGGAAIGVLVATITAAAKLIPFVLTEIGLGILALAKVIGKGGPAITQAIATLLVSLFNAIIKAAPKAAKAFETLLEALLGAINKEAPKLLFTIGTLVLHIIQALAKYAPKWVVAGIDLVVNLINGIASRIGAVINAGVNLVIAFINGTVKAYVRLVNAAASAVLTFLKGIDKAINTYEPQIIAEGYKIAGDIVIGMIKGMADGLGQIGSAAWNLGKHALSSIAGALGINSPSKEFMKVGLGGGEGLSLGFDRSAGMVAISASKMGKNAAKVLGDTLTSLNGLVQDKMNLQPKITPVLDLTKAHEGFNKLATLSKSQIISASVSSSLASTVSANNTAAAAALAQGNSTGTNLTFNQTNNSPQALSTADIYRQTRNQISAAKGVLTG